MTDRFDLKRASTMDPGDAEVRITQVYRRPSLDIPFLENPSEWYDHFIKHYHAPGYRNGQESLSPDKLTLTKQIFWISEERWLAASNHDPVAVENEKRHMAYCEQYGIIHTRIREIKKDGRWWANIINQVDQAWLPMSIGDLMTPQLAQLTNSKPQVLLTNKNDNNG